MRSGDILAECRNTMKWVHRTRFKELECYSFVAGENEGVRGLKKLYGMGDPLSPSVHP